MQLAQRGRLLVQAGALRGGQRDVLRRQLSAAATRCDADCLQAQARGVERRYVSTSGSGSLPCHSLQRVLRCTGPASAGPAIAGCLLSGRSHTHLGVPQDV